MRKNNKKGFTLAELLIVVAIIAVLTAIAIPIFTSQLERSREATDISNIRSYYAEVTSSLLVGDMKKSGDEIFVGNNLTAKLNTDIPASTGTFTVTVAGVTIQQNQDDWQTADFDIAGVKGGKSATGVGNWSKATHTNTTPVTYTYTLASDGDYVLTSIAFGNPT